MPDSPFRAAIRRYNLNGEPFGIRRELDPVLHPEHLQQLVTGCGILDLANGIESPLSKMQNDDPAFFLIGGHSRTGRSTIANVILNCCREIHDVEQGCFLIPSFNGRGGNGKVRDAQSHDPYQVYKEWLRRLYIALIRLKQKGPLVENIKKALKTNTAENYLIDWPILLLNTHTGMAGLKPRYGFAVCLENVRSTKLIEVALQLFELVPTAVVFTTRHYEDLGDEVISEFSKARYADRIRYLPLESLTDEAVEKVAKVRWNGPGSHPFDAGVFDDAFGGSPPTFGRALHLLAWLLQAKAVHAPRPNEKWPKNVKLRYAGNQVRETLPALDKSL